MVRLVAGQLLISGATAFDDNQTTLLGIQREWTNPNHHYATRVANLRGESDNPNRLNVDFFLKTSGDDATVFDDDAFDLLFAGLGRDWFLFDSPDWTLGRRRNESVN